MVLQFEIDCAFGGGKDDGDFMLSPGYFVDVRSILETISANQKLETIPFA